MGKPKYVDNTSLVDTHFKPIGFYDIYTKYQGKEKIKKIAAKNVNKYITKYGKIDISRITLFTGASDNLFYRSLKKYDDIDKLIDDLWVYKNVQQHTRRGRKVGFNNHRLRQERAEYLWGYDV